MNWRPQTTNNGWYPKLNPSGTLILFGFYEVHVSDFSREVLVPSPLADQGIRLNPAGWLDDHTFIAHTESDDTHHTAAIYRGTVDANLNVTLTNLGVPEVMARANWSIAEAGHWGVSGGNNPHLCRDGAWFREDIPGQYKIALGGEYTACQVTTAGYQIHQFKNNDLVRVVPSDNEWVLNKEGDLVTGYWGALQCYPIDGGHVDATITPWRQEGPGFPVRLNGELWLWTPSAYPSGEFVILGRRLGETAPIVLHNFPAIHNGVHVRYTPNGWLVAANNEKGQLEARTVSIDAPREELVGPTKPPPIPLEQINPLHGKWIMGWYEQKGPPELLLPEYGGPQPLPPGNMEWGTTNYPPNIVRPRPMVTAWDRPDIQPEYLVRLGSEGMHNEDGLRKMEQMAWDLYEQQRQCNFYWDGRTVPFWPNLPPDCVWEQNAYCGKDEPLDQFEKFIYDYGREVLGHYKFLVFTAQTHTTNASLIVDPTRAIPPLERVMTRLRQEFGERMAGLVVFNNSGRDDHNPASATYGEGGLTAPNNQDIRPHWEKLFSGITGLPDVFSHGKPVDPPPPGGGDVTIDIIDFPPVYHRGDVKGLPIHFDIQSSAGIIKVEVGLCNQYGDPVEKPLRMTMELSGADDDKDGRYLRMLAWKPVLNGHHYPYIIASDVHGNTAKNTAASTVEVCP